VLNIPMEGAKIWSIGYWVCCYNYNKIVHALPMWGLISSNEVM